MGEEKISEDKTLAAQGGNSRRSGIRIMGQLIGLVNPLLPVMILAIVLGTVGYLCAIFLTILAGYGMMHILLEPVMEALGLSLGSSGAGMLFRMETQTLFIALVVLAVRRGNLHFGEQYCNPFMVFKRLALSRTQVFAALRET